MGSITKKIFSNNYRFLKIFVLFGFLLTLAFYSLIFGPKTELTYPECMTNLREYDSKELIVSGRIRKITNSVPEIFEWNTYIPIQGIKEPLKVGQTISALVTFDKKGFVEVKDYHIHQYRDIKLLVSILAFIIVISLFFREYKFNFRKFVFLRKEKL